LIFAFPLAGADSFFTRPSFETNLFWCQSFFACPLRFSGLRLPANRRPTPPPTFLARHGIFFFKPYLSPTTIFSTCRPREDFATIFLSTPFILLVKTPFLPFDSDNLISFHFFLLCFFFSSLHGTSYPSRFRARWADVSSVQLRSRSSLEGLSLGCGSPHILETLPTTLTGFRVYGVLLKFFYIRPCQNFLSPSPAHGIPMILLLFSFFSAFTFRDE